MSWWRKKITFHSSSARWISSRSAASIGSASETPSMTPPMVGDSGATVKRSYGRSTHPSGRRPAIRGPTLGRKRVATGTANSRRHGLYGRGGEAVKAGA
jgi:hypothetical protein